jgi:predicted HAD superfamily Cof-like phosphohydrolase
MFERVEKFNKEVVKIGDRPMGLLDKSEHLWLVNAIDEEKNELMQAHNQQDYIGYIDALVDNLYFTLGGMVRIGLSPKLVEDIFNAVHECNMTKVKGRKSRVVESDLDATKPEGWVSPEEAIINILEAHNANNP